MRIRWTPTAFSNLRNISDLLRTNAASRLLTGSAALIYDVIQGLVQFPERGRTGMEEGTRELVVAKARSYVVAYRIVSPDTIQILPIWHGAQQRPE